MGRHKFGGTATDALFSLTETSGMNLICTGYSRSYNGFQDYDIVLFKADTAGNIKWLKNFYNNGIDIGYQVLPSAFGGYFITGLYGKNNNDYFVTRSDTIGNVALGINNNLSENKNISLYPNPASSVVYITDNGVDIIQQIALFDILGKQITTINQTRFDVGNLPEGVYFIQIQTNQNSYTQKLIVQP